MKLFLTVALSLMMIALIAHAQTSPPPYPPPSYPPPSYAPAPPAEVIPPPPAYAPSQAPVAPPAQLVQPSPQQAITPTIPRAQSQAQQEPPAPALEAQRQGDITFVSGGAGDDDRAALKQVESQYNLRLLFAARNGDYLAGIGVTLADARGHTVLDTIADGPIFYARVPAGRYRVTVSNQGQAQSRDVSITVRGAVRQDFYWASAS